MCGSIACSLTVGRKRKDERLCPELYMYFTFYDHKNVIVSSKCKIL